MSIELTPELAPEFAVTVRGYDRAQVDEYIDWLREWLSNATVRMESAEAESARLREQVERLQMRVDDLQAETSGEPPRTIGALGERMTRILELAEEGAAAVRADAETEAERLLARARSEAEGQVRGTQQRQAELDGKLADANERAQQTVAQAEARAADAVARQMHDAEAKAKAWEAQARERARELVEGAQLQRSAVLEQLNTEKAALDAHLAALAAQRAEILASLSRLHESLASTIVEVPVAARPVPAPSPASPSGPAPAPPPAPPSAPRLAAMAEPTAQADADDTAANDFAGAVDLRDGPEADRDRSRGDVREFPVAGSPRRNPGARRGKERTVLFDREAVEEEEEQEAEGSDPAPPSFRRAGSQPEGSQRAGQ